MDSKVTAATVQATVLNALSGVFAQGILAYRRGVSKEPRGIIMIRRWLMC